PAVTMRIGEGSDALATTRGLTARRTGVQPRSGPRGVGGEPRPRLGYIAGHAFDDFVGSALDDDVDPRRLWARPGAARSSRCGRGRTDGAGLRRGGARRHRSMGGRD